MSIKVWQGEVYLDLRIIDFGKMELDFVYSKKDPFLSKFCQAMCLRWRGTVELWNSERYPNKLFLDSPD